jgi:ABC-type multidrug transport system fused ATPase/permease subunit
VVDALAGGGLALVMWYGATSVAGGRVTTGDVVVFFAYVTNLYAPMRVLARLGGAFSRAAVAAERIGEILLMEREVNDRPDAVCAPQLGGGVNFRNVTFGYDPGRPVLQDINLRVAPGERIAIVGPSGAGKSTLVSLVARLYDPTSGSVEIDGHDLRSVRVASLREQIGLVLQEPLLFSGTVAENIAFARPEATRDEIVRAGLRAGADEFIRELPDGYDAPIGERGVTLSGGQKQRLAIARAIVRDAPIMIFDEPTSGLDLATETALLSTLAEAAQGKTTFVIAHRLTTVALATRVLVLEAGRIVEDGAPDDLLRRGGHYAQIHRMAQRGTHKTQAQAIFP